MSELPPQKPSLKFTYDSLPAAIKQFLPESIWPYCIRTNELHCSPNKTGGSKFTSINNILEVLAHLDAQTLAARIKNHEDDRDALMSAGASKSAFLPNTRQPGQSPDLPEALYFQVPGIKGELAIEQLSALPDNTPVLVAREKGHSNPNRPENYTPASFTAFITDRKLPPTDFATIIFGRDAGEDQFKLWTIHPGAPIRAAVRDFHWTTDLKSPDEVNGHEKPTAVLTTVRHLLHYISPESYIKISTANLQTALARYDYSKK
ncbi:TPA: hypothetical protein DF272_05135 [Candidatus Falkowbacteria bacterium]|nr:hypothetical protein [Candidatus Falkowbacteria bacterium]